MREGWRGARNSTGWVLQARRFSDEAGGFFVALADDVGMTSRTRRCSAKLLRGRRCASAVSKFIATIPFT